MLVGLETMNDLCSRELNHVGFGLDQSFRNQKMVIEGAGGINYPN